MATELVKVEFHGDALEAIQQDGKVWVSLRRCCENLGLAAERQVAKLRSKPWATTTQKVVVAEDGKQRSLTMIDLDTLPGWLFSIDARRVKGQVRDKLIRYQKEAALVLAVHFFGRRDLAPAPSVEAIVEQVTGRVLAAVMPKLLGFEVVPNGEHITVEQRCRQRWPQATGRQRKRITNLAAAKLNAKCGRWPATLGTQRNSTLAFFREDLWAIDDAIDFVQDEEERRNEFFGR